MAKLLNDFGIMGIKEHTEREIEREGKNAMLFWGKVQWMCSWICNDCGNWQTLENNCDQICIPSSGFERRRGGKTTTNDAMNSKYTWQFPFDIFQSTYFQVVNRINNERIFLEGFNWYGCLFAMKSNWLLIIWPTKFISSPYKRAREKNNGTQRRPGTNRTISVNRLCQSG